MVSVLRFSVEDKAHSRYSSCLLYTSAYSKAFGHHNIDIMAGHDSDLYTLKYQYTHKYNFSTIGNPEFNNAITMSYMNSYTQEHSMESFFGRVNYDFDNTHEFHRYRLDYRIFSCLGPR